MIQIYNPGNINYGKNGDMTLAPLEATVHPVLNGEWEANLKHPIDLDGRWKYISEEAVVKMPSFNGEQLFRVRRKAKSDSGVVATLEPIFMDAMDDCFLVDVRPTKKTGQQAIDLMTAPNRKYTGESDIVGQSTAYYQFKNLMDAINGDDDNSFINRWGGEILFDNYKVVINGRVGGDYGVELRYGKNIPADGLSEDVDIREVVTRIYPKAYNGYTMTGKGHVDSPLINSYPTVKAATITFEDVKMRVDIQDGDESSDIIICDTQEQLDAALKEKCQGQFNKGLDKPKVTITAQMVLLQNTELYKDYKVLENVSLGDTVHCINSHLGIRTDARVVELEYDSIAKKVVSVVLGDFIYNYFDNVSTTVNRVEASIRPDGSIIGEQIKGLINAMNASLQLQSTAAKKVDGRAFLIEDLDPNSGLFGGMEAGTQGLRISKKRNPDNRAWVWTTAITALGIIADAIITGSITSRNWVENMAGFRIDLDNGTINSKHLKLAADGLLTIYRALIDGGEMSIKTPEGKEIFRVDETGATIGADGKAINYDAGTGIVSIYRAVITGGELTVGGADGNGGVITVKDAAGNTIGQWGIGGLDVKSGSISGASVTLGGKGNAYGKLKLLSENGTELVRLDNDGVYSKGKFVCGGDAYGRSIEISEGAFKVLNRDGNEVGRLIATSNTWMRLECGKVSIGFDEDSIDFDADSIQIGGLEGKSGKAEFSDGSYLIFSKGFLMGGQTADGGNI